jgi:hypothetical protein
VRPVPTSRLLRPLPRRRELNPAHPPSRQCPNRRHRSTLLCSPTHLLPVARLRNRTRCPKVRPRRRPRSPSSTSCRPRMPVVQRCAGNPTRRQPARRNPGDVPMNGRHFSPVGSGVKVAKAAGPTSRANHGSRAKADVTRASRAVSNRASHVATTGHSSRVRMHPSKVARHSPSPQRKPAVSSAG